MLIQVRMMIGTAIFLARIRHDLAPQASQRLTQLLPYRGNLLHARWSGEACWSPLAAVWPTNSYLPAENALHDPVPGQVLLFAGGLSEPEIYIPYGKNFFASQCGRLVGNPILAIEHDVPDLIKVCRATLWQGATNFQIDIADR